MDIKNLLDELLLEVSMYHPIPDLSDREHIQTFIKICEDKGYHEVANMFKEEFLDEADDNPTIKYTDDEGNSRTVKYDSAIKYDKEHPAYKAAAAMRGDVEKAKAEKGKGKTAKKQPKPKQPTKEKPAEPKKPASTPTEPSDDESDNKKEQEFQTAKKDPDAVMDDPDASAYNKSVARDQQGKNNLQAAKQADGKPKSSSTQVGDLKSATAQLDKIQDSAKEEDKKTIKNFRKDVESFYKEKDPDKRKEIADKMVKTYELSTNTGTIKKLYMNVLPGNRRKVLGVNKFVNNMLVDLQSAGADLSGAEGSKDANISVAVSAAAKPDLGESSSAFEKDGTTIRDKKVAELFSNQPLSFLDKKYAELHGPIDENGNLKTSSGGENSRLYLEHSIENNKSLDNAIAELKKYPGTEKVVAELEEHKKRMKEVLSKHKIPSPEASQAVGDSYAKMAQGIAKNGDEKITGALMKQFAEMSLYDTEIANGDECYLPAAGSFPSADKVKITRTGTKVERVSSISVKYGLSGDEYSNYGFPGETAQYQKYHPDPDYRDRNASHPGVEGYTLGVRDDLVDDEKKFAEMVEKSGFDQYLKGGKKDIPKVLAILRKAKKDLDKILDEEGRVVKDLPFEQMRKINESYAEELNSLLKSDKDLDEGLGKDNADVIKKGPMAFAMAISFGATLNTSNGLDTIEHNHQVIDEDGKYKSSTDVGSPNIKHWKLGFRAYDVRGGGIITSYNSARKTMPEHESGYDEEGRRIVKSKPKSKNSKKKKKVKEQILSLPTEVKEKLITRLKSEIANDTLHSLDEMFKHIINELITEESTLAGYEADGEPPTGHLPDGKIRMLNKYKPENWFKQLGYTQVDKPKADSIKGKGKDKDKDSQFRQISYHVQNIVQSTLNPAEKPKETKKWDKVKGDVAKQIRGKGETRFWDLQTTPEGKKAQEKAKKKAEKEQKKKQKISSKIFKS